VLLGRVYGVIVQWLSLCLTVVVTQWLRGLSEALRLIIGVSSHVDQR